MYVGCSFPPSIIVIENKKILNTFNGCNGVLNGGVYSIVFDESGYMATACLDPYRLSNPDKVYLFDNNLSYTGKSISTLFIINSNVIYN